MGGLEEDVELAKGWRQDGEQKRKTRVEQMVGGSSEEPGVTQKVLETEVKLRR